MLVEGVVIKNTVALNSSRGAMATDRGPWANGSATALGKDLLYCARHESEGILSAGSGLNGDLKTAFMKDMNAMIYSITSIEKLSEKFASAYSAYGHHSPAKTFMDTLFSLREKLCQAHTQYTFSMLHTTTQLSEGTNASIKGNNTELKTFLADQNLITLHERVSYVNLKDDVRALKELTEARANNKRVSKYYERHVEKSKAMVMDKIQGCDEIKPDHEYLVKRFDGTSHVVNLKSKIVHLGRVYTIPTCTCGFWCSSMIPCMCIAKALNSRGKEILAVENVHPYYLLQLHPLWPDALKRLKRADYDSGSNNGEMKGKANSVNSCKTFTLTIIPFVYNERESCCRCEEFFHYWWQWIAGYH